MISDKPIGFFDSGLGGLSVWQEVNALLPQENTIYLADSKHAPYGIRTKQEIIDLSAKNTEYLLEQGCKIIVIACNTATTKAIKYLRKNYDVPFVGIEPAIKTAAISTQTNSVGVLATEGTLISDLFTATSKKYASEIVTVSQNGTGLVKLIENGQINSPEIIDLLQQFLAPMIAQNIDYLVLGCTHYPFLKPLLDQLLPEGVETIDSGAAIAKRVESLLMDNSLANTISTAGNHVFYTNRSTEIMKDFMHQFGMNYSPFFLDF